MFSTDDFGISAFSWIDSSSATSGKVRLSEPDGSGDVSEMTSWEELLQCGGDVIDTSLDTGDDVDGSLMAASAKSWAFLNPHPEDSSFLAKALLILPYWIPMAMT